MNYLDVFSFFFCYFESIRSLLLIIFLFNILTHKIISKYLLETSDSKKKIFLIIVRTKKLRALFKFN